jgi:excinuclease ABC subunit C
MPGLGPKRRDALLKHFGSIQKIRKATCEELAEVDGVSEQIAAKIILHLASRK